MAISYGEPKNRVEHFKRKFLKFDIQTIKIVKGGNDPKTHYIYLCKKLDGADDTSKKYYNDSLRELDGSDNNTKEQNNDKKKNNSIKKK